MMCVQTLAAIAAYRQAAAAAATATIATAVSIFRTKLTDHHGCQQRVDYLRGEFVHHYDPAHLAARETRGIRWARQRFQLLCNPWQRFRGIEAPRGTKRQRR